MNGKISVYRHYDADGRLLYVGLSTHFVGRHINHLGQSSWAKDVTRITIDLYDDHVEAAIAEREAYAEGPLHNAVAAPLTGAEIERLHETHGMGRPPKWPVPTAEQIGALVADWQSDMKRALVVQRMQERVGAPVPMSWCRDQVIKRVGHARRGAQ